MKKYKIYHYVVGVDHPLPYRVDEGLPIPRGEYVMIEFNDFNSILADAREHDNG